MTSHLKFESGDKVCIGYEVTYFFAITIAFSSLVGDVSDRKKKKGPAVFLHWVHVYVLYVG